MPDDRLYRCNPLRAWLSTRQCQTNQHHAKLAIRKRGHITAPPLLGLETCSFCPGVEHRAEGTRYLPEPLSERPATLKPKRRRSLIPGTNAAAMPQPEGTLSVAELCALTGRGKTSIYERLRRHKVKALARSKRSGTAYYPTDQAKRALGL